MVKSGWRQLLESMLNWKRGRGNDWFGRLKVHALLARIVIVDYRRCSLLRRKSNQLVTMVGSKDTDRSPVAVSSYN